MIKNDNTGSDRGGGIAQANNGGRTTINMYDGAEICRNSSTQTGGGVMVSNGVFNMYGGTISENTAKQQGGGVFVRRAGQFNMSGGVITGNSTDEFGGGISYDASDYNGGVPYANLTGGKISGNSAAIGMEDLAVSSTAYGHMNRYLFIGSEMELDNDSVYMQTGAKTVTPSQRDIMLGNASPASVTALTKEAEAKGWTSPYATFWMQRNGSASISVSKEYDGTMPVYVLAQATNEDGTPADGAVTEIYAVTVNEAGKTVSFTLPDAGASGRAVALVQPGTDNGSVVITGLAQLMEQPDAVNYEVPYVSTYTMSESLANTIKLLQTGINDQTCQFSFTVQLDSRLTAKTGEGDYTFTSTIFEVADVEGSGSTLTVHVKLKADWKAHIDELTTTPMVLTGTGVLNAKDFKAGDMLNTTGTIQGTVKSPGGVHDIAVYIPANNCQTLMAAARQVTLSFDANGGTGAVPEAMSAYVNNAGLAEFSIPDAKLSRDGYVFKGWSENQEGVARYQAKDTLTIGSDTVLYAVWERMFTVTYTVTGDIPDGYKAPESTMVAEGTGYKAADAPEAIKGKYNGKSGTFTFEGWIYKGEMTVKIDAVKENVELKGVWTFVPDTEPDKPTEPGKPAEPDKPAESGGSDGGHTSDGASGGAATASRAVKTGDESNPVFWTVLLVFAAGTAAAACLISRKRAVGRHGRR